jgi:hypothetical protein
MIADSLAPSPDGKPRMFDARDRRGRALRCKVTATPISADGTVSGVVVLMQSADGR